MWKMLNENQKIERLKKSFERKVIMKEGCWGWFGYRTNTGYVLIRYEKDKIPAHRASWIIHKGIIPEGMMVLHKCDNRECTNPKHLFLGTHKDNMKDREIKGRGQKGITHHKCKLTEQQVLEIKNLIRKGLSDSDLSKRFSVNTGTIWFIRNGVTWNHIGGNQCQQNEFILTHFDH